jgi:glutamate dehydrogenase (NADP+)
MRLSWTREEVDQKLHGIMKSIHASCRGAAETYGFKADNYAAGANLAGFVKVANAMLAAGIV